MSARAAHHVVSGAITDSLLLMALGMLLTRTLGLAIRACALPPPAPATATASRSGHDVERAAAVAMHPDKQFTSLTCHDITNPISIVRTDFAVRRGYPGKCRSPAVESNSDPRSVPPEGRRTASSSHYPGGGGDPDGICPGVCP